MRIRLVITSAPPLVGGLEKVCLRLAQQLQKRGHEVEILGRFTQERHKLAGFFRDTEKPGVIGCEGVGVRTITLDARAKLLLRPVFKLIWRESTFPLGRWLYMAAMGGQMRKICEGCDVVHYFGVGREMLGFAAADAARSAGALFCVDPAVHPGQWGSFWIDRKLFLTADRMFCYSDDESRVLASMGVEPARIRKVPCGFDFNDSGNGEVFRRKHDVRGPMVLFLGRKTEMKGVLRLLEAWPLVATKFPEATLVFAGPGRGKEGLLEKLESGKRKAEMMADGGWRIADGKSVMAERDREEGTGDRRQVAAGTNVGWQRANSGGDRSNPGRILDLDDLSEGEKQDALAACDVLCVPSEGESFGMVYFEAWAYKKPVVALDLPVLRETVGAWDAGLLSKPDPASVAKALAQLLGDPGTRHRMGGSGYRLACRHRWEAAADSYMDAYEQTLREEARK